MRTYKAIYGLEIAMFDDDGQRTGEFGIVPEGSLWDQEDSSWRLIDGDIRLLSIVGSPEIGWIEISKETLEEYFEEVQE